jgi:glycogen(starch) synthase
MKDADYVFEVSNEVCNKVGGIYTVVSSKAAQMVSLYRENYFAVGFYSQKNAKIELDEEKPTEELAGAFSRLEAKGIKCHYGRWLIAGRPRTILIDTGGLMKDANEIKTKLWTTYRIDSLNSDYSFTEPLVWAAGVGMLLEELMKVAPYKNARCVAHFHEWISGGGLLYLKDKNVNMSTVFTTHATMLGRTLAGSGVDLYKLINDRMNHTASVDLAKRYGVIDKHTTEMACAKNTDVFTTVSEITGREAKFLLGREPDALLPNGLDMEKYPEMDELTILRRKYRIRTREFLTAYFCRYYPMDMFNFRSIFISGRYEMFNKGIDLYIDALGRLNEKLKQNKADKNIVAFIFVPTQNRGEKVDVLKNTSLFEEMHEHVDETLPEIKDAIIKAMIRGEMPKDLLSEESLKTFKKLVAHFTEKRGQTPPLSAFELAYTEDDDLIIKALRRNGLLNREEDKVKAVFYPAYLSAADRLVALDYDQATMTFDIGVFPSYYEPWGYTPLETAALGCIAVTTDLAGFGRFIEGKGDGIYVLKRENRPWGEMVEDLAGKLYQLVTLSKRELMDYRMSAKKMSLEADWKNLIQNYVTAHDMAVSRLKKNPR